MSDKEEFAWLMFSAEHPDWELVETSPRVRIRNRFYDIAASRLEVALKAVERLPAVPHFYITREI
jgi:hypothetical protein